MPGSNERSVQLIGTNAQIVECVEHFLDDIGKVRNGRNWESGLLVTFPPLRKNHANQFISMSLVNISMVPRTCLCPPGGVEVGGEAHPSGAVEEVVAVG